MDARERLRRYLEQRRELGERELVLDDLSVDDVMRLLGAGQSPAAERGDPGNAIALPGATRVASDEPGRRDPAESAGADSANWREVLRAAGSAPPDRPRRAPDQSMPVSPAAATPLPTSALPARSTSPSTEAHGDAPPGLVVGTASRELFGGPLAHVTSIDAIEALVAKCTRCPLYATATKPVPGEGNPNAELVCVGEAPGEREDATGRPFVGPAGQLLTRILAAIDLRREDVFICNVLKHRPPGNRNPAPSEVEACSPYLVRQLELIRPKVVIAFGTFAAQTLLDTKLPIGKLRRAVHRYYGVPLIVTYHPAALLRNPGWKRPTWEDVQLARRILDRAAGA